uniref:Uncharacterized protein n=1 Tax=Anguilla anguilla TaxID=7936 RepID=A0A0E9T8Z2_ANGAN
MEGSCTLRGCVAWFRSWRSSMMKLNVVILEIPPPPLTMLLPWRRRAQASPGLT